MCEHKKKPFETINVKVNARLETLNHCSRQYSWYLQLTFVRRRTAKNGMIAGKRKAEQEEEVKKCRDREQAGPVNLAKSNLLMVKML